MTKLHFAIKFCMTLFLLACQIGLIVILLLSLLVRKGTGEYPSSHALPQSTEVVSVSLQGALVIPTVIRLYAYLNQRRKHGYDTAEQNPLDRPVFIVASSLMSLASAIWMTVNVYSLLFDLSNLSNAKAATIGVIATVWVEWSVTFHLVWIALLERNERFTHTLIGGDLEKWPPISGPKPLRANSKAGLLSISSKQPRRGFGGRVSAHVVAVQHGSPPEMWAHGAGAGARGGFSREKSGSGSSRATQTSQQSSKISGLEATYMPSRLRSTVDAPPVVTEGKQYYFRTGGA
ncbi:uncharacterized protein BXZ73DRAFT_95801 [Epithele typhae]|uniref:uncharacterized protein n=1 Tax=Epithele typhae TaxID=378194 RepID=UPI0020088A54|nr:uncharacterized protein BXZ73DRAFT_95801 [Epithele typhae]KAH9946297.1 hypothetical protein BXZ73DRAFT_95801 [Epithele typhae]